MSRKRRFARWEPPELVRYSFLWGIPLLVGPQHYKSSPFERRLGLVMLLLLAALFGGLLLNRVDLFLGSLGAMLLVTVVLGVRGIKDFRRWARTAALPEPSGLQRRRRQPTRGFSRRRRGGRRLRFIRSIKPLRKD